jgi:hypothetical protein
LNMRQYSDLPEPTQTVPPSGRILFCIRPDCSLPARTLVQRGTAAAQPGIRRICVDLCRELVRLRPGWQHEDDDKGSIKVVMTGSASDSADWQPHIRNKPRREALANVSAMPPIRSGSCWCATCG